MRATGTQPDECCCGHHLDTHGNVEDLEKPRCKFPGCICSSFLRHDWPCLSNRLADELAWWINWAKDAESVPRRSFEEARRTGMALIGELDPRRVGR
jgi:hypothetical protein